MLYLAIWLMYALLILVFVSVGLWGLFCCCSFSVPGGMSKRLAMISSILIIVTGIYFFYQWNAKRAEIREVGQQLESALRQYLTPREKDM